MESQSPILDPGKDGFMPQIVIPCYGGPYDGRYYPEKQCPIGYREFSVRGRIVWLWKAIKVERIDFNTLSKASRLTPSAFDDTEQELQ